jgi:hypothetical protein
MNVRRERGDVKTFPDKSQQLRARFRPEGRSHRQLGRRELLVADQAGVL